MVTRHLPALVLTSFVLFACGPSTQILILKNSPIMGVQNPALNSVKQAIVVGCKAAGWKVEDVKPGQLIATFNYEDLMAKVDILYSTDSYDIVYKDSRNLNHEDNLIHPRYNRWVLRLDKSIRHATLKL